MRKEAGTHTALKLKGTPGDLGKPSGTPAYLIAIYTLTDREKLTRYAEVARPLLTAAGGTFIVTSTRKDIELLEGNFGNVSISIIQFPSLAALRTFYEDPAYQGK